LHGGVLVLLTICLAAGVGIYYLIARLTVGNVTTHDIAGTYWCDYGYGSERIVLLETGGYQQTFMPLQGTPITCQGHWSLSGTVVCLDNSLFIDDAFGKMASTAPSRASWCLPIVRSLNNQDYILTVNGDLGFYAYRERDAK
jgi:hypothetical protein